MDGLHPKVPVRNKVIYIQCSAQYNIHCPALTTYLFLLPEGNISQSSDLVQAYLQMKIPGLCQYNQFVIGIALAIAICQSPMDKVLHWILQVGSRNTSYINVIIVTGKRDEEHLQTYSKCSPGYVSMDSSRKDKVSFSNENIKLRTCNRQRRLTRNGGST